MKKVLIANRSEIALRIIRTCKRLGIETVAIYSESDQAQSHVFQADQAFSLGQGSVLETYLNVEKILRILERSEADALHPGYGFLSENPDFAQAVIEQGAAFIGPAPETLRLLGLKHAARQAATLAGIQVIPGYDGDNQELSTVVNEIRQLGFPVMVKASAGGGGKGLRRIDHPSQLKEGFAAAKREATAFFGDNRLIVERAFEAVRHVEVQLIGDAFGNVLHLFERDCSIQRRSQKVIEEAPAPFLPEELRQDLLSAAIKLARAVNLVGATTMEFLIPRYQEQEGKEFYFLEANPRIQVEHPVTEVGTGLDIVELQLLVADGKELRITQDEIVFHGHAIEARLYAEIPEKDFLPNTGRIHFVDFSTAEALGNVRVDHALTAQLEVTTQYDPMLAKVIAWGKTREEAQKKLWRALQEVKITGVSTNSSFLCKILQHPEFVSGNLSTNFIAKHRADLIFSLEQSHHLARQILCCILFARLLEPRVLQSPSADRTFFDPFEDTIYWRSSNSGEENSIALFEPTRKYSLSSPALREEIIFAARPLRYHPSTNEAEPGQLTISIQDLPAHQSTAKQDNQEILQIKYIGAFHFIPDRECRVGTYVTNPIFEINGAIKKPVICRHGTLEGGSLEVRLDGHEFIVSELRETLGFKRSEGGTSHQVSEKVTSPLPGSIISIEVAVATRVTAGDTLVILESMKMEHRILAPRDAVVREIYITPQAIVQAGQVMLVLE